MKNSNTKDSSKVKKVQVNFLSLPEQILFISKTLAQDIAFFSPVIFISIFAMFVVYAVGLTLWPYIADITSIFKKA